MVGECRPDKQEIYIQTVGHKRKHVLDTCIHELLHAIRDEYQIDHKNMKEEELYEFLDGVMKTYITKCEYPC